jgi:serine/threonine protein kinase
MRAARGWRRFQAAVEGGVRGCGFGHLCARLEVGILLLRWLAMLNWLGVSAMLREGEEIAGYRILRRIGAGGMGQVFLAEQLRLKRQVALKVVLLDSKSDTPAGEVAPAEELTREAQSLMALEHPHILPLYDAGRANDLAYLVMPYFPDGSLQDALRGSPPKLRLPLPPGEALIYIEQAASALQYAHDRNFIHRDVKPANFLVRPLARSTSQSQSSSRLHLFLADFGLSKFVAYSNSTTHLSGTPVFMAPEQFQGRPSQASDQYSLAILFYHLLTGQFPFLGSPVELMFKHMNEAPPLPQLYAPGIPEALAKVVLRGIAKRPEDRYPSVIGLADAARDALMQAGMILSPDSAAMPAVRPADLAGRARGAGLEGEEITLPVSPGLMTPVPVTPPPITVPPVTPLPASSAPVTPLPVQISGAPASPKMSSYENPYAPTQGGPGQNGESSLPTLAAELPRPRPAEGGKEGRSRRGLAIGLGALAVLIVIGAVFGGSLLLRQNSGPPVVQANNTSTPAVTATTLPATATIPAATATTVASPTVVPADAVIATILAGTPIFTVDMGAGSSQWDIQQINKNANYRIRTQGGTLQITNLYATLLGHSFPTPLAVVVDMQASSNPEFDVMFDTTNPAGVHVYYRLQLFTNAPPKAGHSSDNVTYTEDGAGASTNASWTNGQSHRLILALDGTRLIFALDGQSLIDATIPQPQASAVLIVGTPGTATVTGIKLYNVPQN